MLGPSAWLFALNGWLIAAGGLVFLWSALEYARQTHPRISILLAAAAAFALWSVAYRFHILPIGPNYGTSALFVFVFEIL